MITYAQIVDKQTKLVVVGNGTDSSYYKSIGMTQMDVEQAYNGAWYVKGYAPSKPEPTTEEKVRALENETGLTRAVREIVLSGDVTVSKYVIDKATEIEDLAKQLRTTEETSGTVDNTQNDEYNSFGDTKQ